MSDLESGISDLEFRYLGLKEETPNVLARNLQKRYQFLDSANSLAKILSVAHIVCKIFVAASVEAAVQDPFAKFCMAICTRCLQEISTQDVCKCL